ncbi:hypothetical protein [Bacillus mycoides]|uniref:hypothetical protein n=1 Tax=Bacillus mycoides TaxID=1405 RepID=UPI002E1DA84B|nr:hypothetical protein [Bacillus mycoides]
MLIDFSKFKGTFPYSKEMYGIFQPLIGWKSRLTMNRINNQFPPISPIPSFNSKQKFTIDLEDVIRVHDFIDLFKQNKEEIQFDTPDFLDSLIVRYLQLEIRKALPSHPPEDNLFWSSFWNERLNEDSLNKLLTKALESIKGHPLGDTNHFAPELQSLVAYINKIIVMFDRSNYNEVGNYIYSKELYVAHYLNSLLPKTNQSPSEVKFPENINNLLLKILPGLDVKKTFELLDPMYLAVGTSREAIFSPIGIIHLFQQYFFEFDTFLGPPVEHIWLSPGSTTELIEVSTRKILQESNLELFTESILKTEHSNTTEDELSLAVHNENQKNTKLGSSITAGASFIAHVEASGSMSIEETQKKAREETHRTMRQQSSKLSSEIRNNYKSTFKTVTEISDMRSKRYVINNPCDKLVNYELRRKMRQVGVQVQDFGTQLCWQVYIDDPGAQLGISQLVHLASKSDLSPYAHLLLKTEPKKITDVINILLPVPNPGQRSDIGPIAAAGFLGMMAGGVPGAVVGVAALEVLDSLFGKDNDKKGDYKIIPQTTIHQQYKINLPEGYQIAPRTAQLFDDDYTQGDNSLGDIPIRWLRKNGIIDGHYHMTILNASEGTLNLVINGGKVAPGELIEFQAKISLVPTPTKIQAITDENNAIKEENKKRDIERERKMKEEFVNSVKERVKFASQIKSRKTDDLREEERTVIYRNLIEKLMRDAWSLSTNRNLAHLRSELIKSIFDVDKMLYYVAPEWWQPRLHQSSLETGAELPRYGLNAVSNAALNNFLQKENFFQQMAFKTKLGSFAKEDLVGWGGAGRKDNYFITEDSNPARLGSSLGWLIQLDGDNLRNAFLNAPWVKAVIPIRPGKEKDALEWLKQSQVEGSEGLDEIYDGDDKEAFQQKYFLKFGVKKELTIEEVLTLVTEDIKEKHDEANKIISEDIQVGPGETKTIFYSRPDEVFEKGFDPLQGGLKVSLDPDPHKKHFRVFDQWVEILPTDQIVAVEVNYNPTTGMQIPIQSDCKK